jgi:glycosyltransferase involved in cell wall biosynthesis
VTVVSFEEPPGGALGPEFEQAGVEVRRLTKRRGGFDRTLPSRLARLFHDHRITVVHTHNPMPLVYAGIPAKLAGARLVHTKHGPHPDKPHRLWLRRLAGVATDAFVAVSDTTRDFAQQIREVSPRKLSIIINATDLDRFRADPELRRRARESWGVAPQAFVIGTVGRVAEVKNHALLVEAAAPLLGPETHLVIAGDGPELEPLRALVAELGVEAHVHLLGMQRDIATVMNGFDVFALSSNVEGLPLVLTEAMGCSLPVVATAVGGVPKVVDAGETGLLCPPRDAAALRAGLAEIRADRDRAAAMGRRGREVAERRYSIERMAAEYMALYQPA